MTLTHGPATCTPAWPRRAEDTLTVWSPCPGGTTAQEGQRRGTRASSLWGHRSGVYRWPCRTAGPAAQPISSHWVMTVIM